MEREDLLLHAATWMRLADTMVGKVPDLTEDTMRFVT